MMQSSYQVFYNNSIVTALLYSNMSVDEKEQKFKQFVNEIDDRYDELCDNIDYLLVNKETNNEENTLYLSVDGHSFITKAEESVLNAYPVLTINRYSPESFDISMYLELALSHFSSHCDYIKSTQKVLDFSA